MRVVIADPANFWATILCPNRMGLIYCPGCRESFVYSRFHVVENSVGDVIDLPEWELQEEADEDGGGDEGDDEKYMYSI